MNILHRIIDILGILSLFGGFIILMVVIKTRITEFIEKRSEK